jgi:hypothetical protein
MTEYNYNEVIKYIDNTYDDNFQKARHWANTHNTTFEELVEQREMIDGVLYRYFQIGEQPVEDVNAQRIALLKMQLAQTDYVVIKIAEGEATKEEYADVLANRKAWREEIRELEK